MRRYNVSELIKKSSELGLDPIDVWRRIKELPATEYVGMTTVYRVFELGRGREKSIRSIAKVLGFRSLKPLEFGKK